MNVTKCDICNEKIEGPIVRAGVSMLHEKDFCSACGKPVLDFLKMHNFINQQK